MTSGTSDSSAPHGSFAAGMVLGGYRLERCIGVGGMGEVYEARQINLDKPVALKVMRQDLVVDESVRERFLQEGRLASKLEHDNVVKVHFAGVTQAGIPYLAMDLLQGTTLSRYIRQRGRLDGDHASEILLPIMSAAEHAHRQRIIHRDLKPDNIFLTADAHGALRPKVLDFGISKWLDRPAELGATAAAGVVGTPYYMAPEQARGDVLDERADQYGLGAVLYEMVTGQPPFVSYRDRESLLWAIQSVELTPPRRLGARISRNLERALLRGMAKRPEDRFESVGAFAAAMGLQTGSRRRRGQWFVGQDRGPSVYAAQRLGARGSEERARFLTPLSLLAWAALLGVVSQFTVQPLPPTRRGRPAVGLEAAPLSSAARTEPPSAVVEGGTAGASLGPSTARPPKIALAETAAAQTSVVSSGSAVGERPRDTGGMQSPHAVASRTKPQAPQSAPRPSRQAQSRRSRQAAPAESSPALGAEAGSMRLSHGEPTLSNASAEAQPAVTTQPPQQSSAGWVRPPPGMTPWVKPPPGSPRPVKSTLDGLVRTPPGD